MYLPQSRLNWESVGASLKAPEIPLHILGPGQVTEDR